MYLEQTAAMQVNGAISSNKKNKAWCQSMMCDFPIPFTLYNEITEGNREGYPTIKVGGHNLNNLRCPDETVFIAESKEDLQCLLDNVGEERRKIGLKLIRKTEIMVAS